MDALLLPTPPADDADRYIAYLGASVTPFHAVEQARIRLEAQGFVAASVVEPLAIVPGDRIYLIHPDGKSILALVIGTRSPAATGFSIWGAHTDSPDLRLRMNPLEDAAGTTVLSTQFHGGIIRRAWLDRPLALAGAAYHVVRGKAGKPKFSPVSGQPVVARQLVHVDKPVAIIPDLAIHLDREKNDTGAINAHDHLNAVLASAMDVAKATELLSVEAGVKLDELDGFDLHLIPWHKPVRAGVDRSLVVGPRHDDLAMVYAGLAGLLLAADRPKPPSHTMVAAFFDAEETGSRTASGAASSFLRDTLLRVVRRHPKTTKAADPETALARSIVISGDMAHALHPNHPDKHDKNHAPLINQGIVVKVNTNDRYATTGETTAMVRAWCEAAEVPVQAFVGRQDLGCGTTIGPITAAQLGARTVDIGLPQWAMHSTFETMGAHDMAAAIRLATTFFAGK